MKKEDYASLISDYIFPFACEFFNNNMEIHQDNDSKHKSNLCSGLLRDLNINWVLY